MTHKASIEGFLSEIERESDRFVWNGTFADYLRMVIDNPSLTRLSHKLIYDAIISNGVNDSGTGEPTYKLFDDAIFGVNDALHRIVQYFASSSRRLEIRKRILLMIGPPASGKSSIVGLIKQALEEFTRTDNGAVYAIKGCPMQEDPLHLIPHQLRDKLMTDYGIYVEGDLCPKCRYTVRTTYKNRTSEVPISRVTFSEREAIGIGYYVSTNPNPKDASLLVGSVNADRLEGDRLEVAGKAFRLDGEFNVSNRGLMEFVEIFKADPHLLTTLLSLAQEQVIKMERFGTIYADEVIIGHSNEGDFEQFKLDRSSEALKDRIIEIRVPYNLRVSDEVAIYGKMLSSSSLESTHIPPTTLPAVSTFAVLSRLDPSEKQGVSLLDKLRLYNDQKVTGASFEQAAELKRHHPNEGMTGISPRYVMNRLSTVANLPEITCVSPLNALDSLWRGLKENVMFKHSDRINHIGFLKNSISEHNERAIQELQKAFYEGFEESALEILTEYLTEIAEYVTKGEGSERTMRDMERHIKVSDLNRNKFRHEVHSLFSKLKTNGTSIDHTSDPRIKMSIETRLFPNTRQLQRVLTRPRFAKQRAEWRRERSAICNRLIASYGYCPQCANDLIEYALHILKNKTVIRTPKDEGVEWLWDLNPMPPEPEETSADLKKQKN